MSKTGIASLATEPVNLTHELDNGIIVIRQVKTVGYDVDKCRASCCRVRIAGKKIKLGSRRMIFDCTFLLIS